MRKLKAVAATCDETERDEYVLSHLKLVKPIALRIKRELPEGFEEDDLVGAGYLGLVKAAASYDTASGVPFEFWAKTKIRGEILDSVNREAFQYAANKQPIESISAPAETRISVHSQRLGFMMTLALESLTTQEKRLLELLYIEDWSCRQIGQQKVMDIGEKRAQQVHKEALRKLRTALKRAA